MWRPRIPTTATSSAAVIGLTIAGTGPIAGFAPHSTVLRVLLLQALVASVTLSSLLVSALLNERDLAHRHLARSLAAARAARWKALEADHAKARFLAVMSHEMRTPLNGAMGFAQIIASRDDLPAQAHEQAEIIVKAGGAMVELIDDVLEFSRLDSEHCRIESAPFDLAKVVDEAAAQARSLLEAKPVCLSTKLTPQCHDRYVGDERRLRQILRHLLSNAAKFTDRGAIMLTVDTVAINTRASLCRISVRDTGPGIAAEDSSIVFEPFQQIDNSLARKHDGMGIGLAITKSLVLLMGGRIGVVSKPGEGAEFWVELPFRRPFQPLRAAAMDPRSADSTSSAITRRPAFRASTAPASSAGAR